MPPIDMPINEDVLKKLLDVYSDITGLSIVFYTDSGEFIHSNEHFLHWPKFCQEICRIVGPEETCDMDCLKIEDAPHQCYAGLWCQSRPVRVNEEKVGVFVVGYRRIRGREEESKEALEQELSDHNIDAESSDTLRKLLEQVDAVDENAFDIKLLEKLSFIEQYAITEHKRAIIAHTHAIAFKAEAVNLAHEFLLPIQSIIADAGNLFNEAEEGSELKGIAEDVLQQVTKLSFIAENIRGSVLEERDKFGYEFHDVDIYPIIQDAINLFRKEAKKKGVVINNPIVEGVIPFSIIEMSKPHIEQVFFNLIHNAVKYSYASTEQSERCITVVCKSYRNFYCVEISNYGVGIKPEEISKGLIFKNGYRGELARDSSRTGSGFGLGRVKKVIEAHNGHIEIKSTQMGTGTMVNPYRTTVTVCIPLYQPRKG
jgi:signal transduction histidine kinase